MVFRAQYPHVGLTLSELGQAHQSQRDCFSPAFLKVQLPHLQNRGWHRFDAQEWCGSKTMINICRAGLEWMYKTSPLKAPISKEQADTILAAIAARTIVLIVVIAHDQNQTELEAVLHRLEAVEPFTEVRVLLGICGPIKCFAMIC